MIVLAWCLAAFCAAIAVILGCYSLRARRSLENTTASLRGKAHHLEQSSAHLSKALRAAQSDSAWYERLARGSRDIVLTFAVEEGDRPSCFLDANDTACTALGYTLEELRALSPLDIEMVDRAFLQQAATSKMEPAALANALVLGRDSELAARALRLAFQRTLREGALQYKAGYVTKGGRVLPVQIHAYAAARAGRTLIVCTAHDTTEEDKEQERLRRSEQRHHDFFTNSPVGVVLCDGQRQMMEVNAACLKIFGCPDRAEFAKFDLFNNRYIPSAVKRDISKGNSIRFELVMDFDEAVRAGLFVSSRKGQAWFDLLINNLGLDRNYSARGFLIQIQDISSRRETEAVLRQRDKQLRQAQKLEAIGALAGGIAHDFNNILTPILGYAELGLDLCADNEKLAGFLNEIRHSSQRAKDLVGQILTFSRQTDGTTHPIRLTPIVKEVIKQVAATLPDGIRVSRAIKTEEDRVMASPTQIHQILMNLCANAAHVMRDGGGDLEVRLSSFVLGRHHRKEFPQLVTRDYLREDRRDRFLRVSVRDTGSGMDAETMDRIFEPFFTTKTGGEGTGMGLAVVHGIVRSMDGAVSVESAVGRGSTFHVVLPAVDEPVWEEEKALPEIPAGTHCILFVDDEVGIVRMAEHMLRSMGFEPVVCSESQKALEIFKRQPERFDVVITDQVMPEMTGSELAEQLLAIRPDLPVVMCTGFSETITPSQARSLGVREVVLKPIERRELAAAIQRAILACPTAIRPDEIVDGGAIAEEAGKTQLSV